MAYDIETIVLAVALMAGMLVIARLSLALRRSVRRGGNLGAIPDELSHDGDLACATGFADRRARLSSDLVGMAATLAADDRDRVYHALWHAMLLEAGADGGIDPKETRFVTEFFEQLSGRKLPAGSAGDAAGEIAAHPQRALNEIAKARATARRSRRCILECAMLVSLTHGRLIESEANRLGEIAEALGIGLDERTAIYASITNRLKV